MSTEKPTLDQAARDFVQDLAANYDHDEDAHRHRGTCFVCTAEELDRQARLAGTPTPDSQIPTDPAPLPAPAAEEVVSAEEVERMRRLLQTRVGPQAPLNDQEMAWARSEVARLRLLSERDEAVRLLHLLDRPEARHPDVAAFLDGLDEQDGPQDASAPCEACGRPLTEGERTAEQERAAAIAFIDGPYEYMGDWADCVVTRRENVKDRQDSWDADTFADDVCVEIVRCLERGDHVGASPRKAGE